MVTWEACVAGWQESLKCGGTPQRAARPSNEGVNDVCVNLGSCVVVARYLGSKYLWAASLALLGSKSCFPTPVPGRAGVGALRVTLL